MKGQLYRAISLYFNLAKIMSGSDLKPSGLCSILEKTYVSKNNKCWTWQKPKHQGGYGRIHISKGRNLLVHRLMYLSFIGKISAGLVLDHKCKTPSCINPNHLEAVTPRENALRGQGICAINSRKTRCSKGHPYSKKNTYFFNFKGRTGRVCRTCKKVWQRKYDANIR